jgi:cytochrome c
MSGMTKSSSTFIVAAAVLAAAFLPSAGGQAQTSRPPAALPAADGARLYQIKCGSCHAMTTNKNGPAHKGVFGRKAAMAAGYNYSPALRAANVTWTAESLDQWLRGPQKMVKGSKMYLVVASPAERASIIGYLASDAAK